MLFMTLLNIEYCLIWIIKLALFTIPGYGQSKKREDKFYEETSLKNKELKMGMKYEEQSKHSQISYFKKKCMRQFFEFWTL